MLRGPFGGDLKKEIFVPKAKDTYKVYEQGVVLQRNPKIGTYYISKEYFDTKMHRFQVKPKDFLVSCSGAYYGAIYQLGDSIEKGVINQALLRIRLNNELIDDNYFGVGSSNFDYRSFRYMYEIMLFGDEPMISEQLSKHISETIELSGPFVYSSWKKRPLINKFFEWLLLPFRHLL